MAHWFLHNVLYYMSHSYHYIYLYLDSPVLFNHLSDQQEPRIPTTTKCPSKHYWFILRDAYILVPHSPQICPEQVLNSQ